MPLQPIPLSSLRKTGVGLVRPEDVVVSRDGQVWASDQQSACAEILPDGTLRRVGKAGGAPNGINMDRDGNIVIANFFDGPLQRLDVATGAVTTVVSEVNGRRITHSNYPQVDSRGNIWCTNSTDGHPWELAFAGGGAGDGSSALTDFEGSVPARPRRRARPAIAGSQQPEAPSGPRSTRRTSRA